MRTHRLSLVALAFSPLPFLIPDAAARDLTFEDRVKAQTAIEQVYWNHRIWPKENPGPKPVLSVVLPEDAIRAKVEDYLKKSSALEEWWHGPIDREQLQAEMNRMASDTKEPNTLRELFEAVGSDPFVIAETLARQTLAERLIRSWYASDSRFHGELRRRATRELAGVSHPEDLKALGVAYTETTWRLGRTDHGPRNEERNEIVLDQGGWERQMRWLAGTIGADSGGNGTVRAPGVRSGTPNLEELPVRRVSRLHETDEAFFATVVLEKGTDFVKTATVSWPKTVFDSWWAEQKQMMTLDQAQTAGAYSAPTVTDDTSCVPDTWAGTFVTEEEPRFSHTAVWTGTEMIVWGGYNGSFLATGSRYNPSTDTWNPIANTGAPDARNGHTAVWTGSRMIVWGGQNDTDRFNSGGRYDPSSDTWESTSTDDAPDARISHTAVWTGTEMIVWGGEFFFPGGGSTWLGTGGRYNPSSDTWAATSMADAPPARYLHTSVWTGTEMIVWGGESFALLNSGGRYNPTSNSWIATSVLSAPDPRIYHTAVWTGSEMIVWGGFNFAARLNTGGRYNPANDTWVSTSPTNAPEGRQRHTAVWVGAKMVVWGGNNGSAELNSGSRYSPSTDTWAATSTRNVPTARELHTAVVTAGTMIVWGGYDGSVLNTGGRYTPAFDAWNPVATHHSSVSKRYLHTAVWTGTEMIVWGGAGGGNTGGRYVPALDSWTSTSVEAGVPAGYEYHTAVWTGSDMIVWGGEVANDEPVNSGGRYSPTTDSWSPTSIGAGVPAARIQHAAVWTGSEMIVWGGSAKGNSRLNTGGRYSPASDSWTPTSSVGAGVPSARYSPEAVWTGSEMIVWGGSESGPSTPSTGGRYSPAADAWTSTSIGAGVPVGRLNHTAVWTGNQMIVWGGNPQDGSFLNSGGRYSPADDSWTPTSIGANVPAPRIWHTAVWTGSEMIIWGGEGVSAWYNSGGRYNPVTESWIPTTSGANVPSGRRSHTAVWTGSEMIVWGGTGSQSLDTGGRYCGCSSATWAWYPDGDGDGFGDSAGAVAACAPVPGYVSTGSDCDDARASVYPGAPQMCDGLNNDCNAPGWPSLVGTNEYSDDGDALSECQGDCDDANAAVWAISGEVMNLVFSSDAWTLTWSPPAAPGGTTVLYDALRSGSPSNFDAGGLCVESDDGSDTQAVDSTTPAIDSVFFYLIRAENTCGAGSLGWSSAGAERQGRNCP